MLSIKYAPKHLKEFNLEDINIKNIKHIPHTIIYGDYGWKFSNLGMET